MECYLLISCSLYAMIVDKRNEVIEYVVVGPQGCQGWSSILVNVCPHHFFFPRHMAFWFFITSFVEQRFFFPFCYSLSRLCGNTGVLSCNCNWFLVSGYYSWLQVAGWLYKVDFVLLWTLSFSYIILLCCSVQVIKIFLFYDFIRKWKTLSNKL